MDALYPFQKEAISYLLEHPRALLALDTGLGKTRVCIEVAKALKLKPLVFCPTFLVENWKRECLKWGAEGFVIDGYGKAANLRHVQMVASLCPEKTLIILDEFQYLRNWSAARTRNILQNVAPHFPRFIACTATPYVRSATDLHPLLSSIQPGRWGKYKDFREKFCLKKPDDWNPGSFIYYGVKKNEAPILKAALAKVGIFYKKHEVLPQLPSKIVTEIPINISPELTLKKLDIPIEDIMSLLYAEVEPTGRIATARRAVGLSKIPILTEWLENLPFKTQGVIFGWHRDVLQELHKKLPRSLLLIGGYSTLERQHMVDSFQSGTARFLVASIGAAGVGLNLTAASFAAFIELPWSPSELKQCEDRIHRIGQKKSVNIYHFVASDSIDDLVMDVLNKKKRHGAMVLK